MAFTTKQLALGGIVLVILIIIIVMAMPSPIAYVPGWQAKSVADTTAKLGGNSETPATCRQLARDGGYIAWGHRDTKWPDPAWRNTCFAYRSIVPFSGESNTIGAITGCVADGKSPSTGCI